MIVRVGLYRQSVCKPARCHGLGAVDGTRTRDHLLGKQEPYQLGHYRIAGRLADTPRSAGGRLDHMYPMQLPTLAADRFGHHRPRKVPRGVRQPCTGEGGPHALAVSRLSAPGATKTRNQVPRPPSRDALE